MSKKISELTSAVSITGTEEVPIVQSGETKKATVDLLRPPIATEITSSSTNTEVAGAKAVYDEISLKTNSNNIVKTFWHGTQAQYDALGTYDSTTLYLIDEE